MEIKIDELTVGQIKQIQSLFNGAPAISHPFKIGANYFIRTVTMNHTGRLVEVTPTELVLEDAAWIADTGRFSDALKSSLFDEIEPFPKGRTIIGRGALIDAAEVSNIPTSQK